MATMTASDAGGAPTAPSQPELSLAPFIAQLRRTLYVLGGPVRRHVSTLSSATVLAAGLALSLSFLMSEEYTSNVSFFVDRTSRRLNLPSGLAGLAQQVGLGEDEAGQPLEFYGWLATSYHVLRTTLFDTVPQGARRGGSDRSASGTAWVQLFAEPYPLDTVAEARGVKRLRDHVRTTVDLRTSLVTIAVSAPTRRLAMWFAERIFAEVNEANTVTRQTRAGNELHFLRARQQHAAEELQSAEQALSSFYQQNRRFQDSPALVFEEERRKRAVDLAREVYLSLTRSAQDAELRAVRDIPALTLIEGPVVPIRRSKPRRLLLTVVGGLLGFALAYARAWFRETEVLVARR